MYATIRKSEGSARITPLSDQARQFWDRFDRDTDSGCWLWLGPLDYRGEGMVYFAGKTRRVMRVAYWLSRKGKLPREALVLHTCKGSPNCARPSHLRLGTVQDRQRGMIKRQSRLEPHREAIAELLRVGCSVRRAAGIFRTSRSILYKMGYRSTLPPGNPEWWAKRAEP